MKILNKFTASLIMLLGLSTFVLFPSAVMAVPLEDDGGLNPPSDGIDCGGIQTSFNYFCGSNANKNARVVEQTPIFAFMLAIMYFLSFGVGLAVVMGILIGSYHIITANGSASKVEQGANIIWNSIIGLVLFIFMFAFINFLVPGGLFK